MRTILVMLQSGAPRWADLLREFLPEHRVMTERTGPDPVHYVVLGKPAPGVVASLGPLDAIFSVNAGVEALLESGEIPPAVPIVRMADRGLGAGMREWVVAEVMAWHRNLFAYRDAQRDLRWAPSHEKLASERPVAVLGAGHLGAPAAETLARLGFPVSAWSRTGKRIEGVRCLSGPSALEAVVDGAEILVNLLPLTPQTENILAAPLLRRLARGSVLINAGRGRHVVDADLLAMLDEGHLRAAVLDVFREEPLPSAHPFWRHAGVFVSPHVAAPTHAASAAAVIAANIRDLEAGRPLRDVVDRARGY